MPNRTPVNDHAATFSDVERKRRAEQMRNYWKKKRSSKAPRHFTKKKSGACLADAYRTETLKRPDLSPIQFIEELQAGKIQISIEGYVLNFEEF
jgi:hypothetical protein